jgi:hypothetical protein
MRVQDDRVAHASGILERASRDCGPPFWLAHPYGGGTQSQRLFRRDAETSTRNARALRKELIAQASPELRSSVFAIELRDETGADLCWTYRFTLVSVGTIAEPLRVHYAHHF